MKNIYVLGILLLAISFSVSGQSQRLILFEEFTNASCGPCALQNPGFNALLDANPSKCTSIKYQTVWPGVDPMNAANKTEVATRVTYYGVTGVPNAFMDAVAAAGPNYLGSPANMQQSVINAKYAVTSPFTINISQRLNAAEDTLFIIMVGKATEAVSGNLVAHCVAIEKHIHFLGAPGSNGETDFYNVMKKMFPSASGTVLPSSFKKGEYFIQQFAWKLANVYKIEELSVVGFIQNNSTKEVLQSANSTTQPITAAYDNDVFVSTISNVLPTYCKNTFQPTIQITNAGTQPLTSALIKYEINSDKKELTWTGNLEFLQTATITLPETEFTLKSNNLLTIYNSLTNGKPDEFPVNDTVKYSFPFSPFAGMQVKVIVKTDSKPLETTWEIKDSEGNIVANDGPYSQSAKIFSSLVDLEPGKCYQFTVKDSGNDGVCCGSGSGMVILSYVNSTGGTVTLLSGTTFGASQTYQFYSASGVGFIDNPDAVSFSVSPNPASDRALVRFENAVNEKVTMEVINMQGVTVKRVPVKEFQGGTHEINLDLTNLRSGLYSVRFTAGTKIFKKNIVITH